MRDANFVLIVGGMMRSRLGKVAGASLSALFALAVAGGCDDTMQEDGDQQEQEQQDDGGGGQYGGQRDDG